jgi:hypothetical protein
MFAAEQEAAVAGNLTTPAVELEIIVAKPLVAQVPPKVEAEPDT